MKERPILFSAPMILALLAGTKTQTRRIVKPQPATIGPHSAFKGAMILDEATLKTLFCPYGWAGDRLWVKETWAAPHDCDHLKPTEMAKGTRIHPRATWEGPSGLLWRPSLFMRRWMSRITLEIAAVRVERLQAISEADAIAEGLERSPIIDAWRDGCGGGATDPRHAYERLWESINGAGSWAVNPWVWVVGFKRLEAAHG